MAEQKGYRNFSIALLDRVSYEDFIEGLNEAMEKNKPEIDRLYGSGLKIDCCSLNKSYGADNQQGLSRLTKYFDAFVIRGDTKFQAALERSNGLCAIVRAGAGLDNIDQERAHEKDIEVYNTPGANSVAVAEVVTGAVLMSGRRLLDTFKLLYSGVPDKEVKAGYDVPGIEGSSASIIGVGNIGLEAASRFLMFDMEVKLYDSLKGDGCMDDLKAHLARKGWSYSNMDKVMNVTNLDDAFRDANYVTLHVPLTDDTRGMVGKRQIQLMKEGAVLINTSRQGIVDEKAVVDSIGHISMYFTDLEIKDPELLAMAKDKDNTKIVRTPHICANTEKAQEKAASIAGKRVVEYLLAKSDIVKQRLS